MGSFVGLSSGTSLDQQEPTTKEKDSPTRYADQLFHAHATTSSGHSLLTQHQPNIKQQHKLSKAATFSIRASQKSPRVDTTEIQASRVYQSSEPFANGSGNSGGVGTTRVNSSKRVLQRTHSQNLHSLAEGVASSSGYASVGSSPSPPNRPFRRLSPSVADPRESPTRYADALFRPRTLEPLSPSTEAETTSTILSP
ncbi:unnamed protein product [Phytophthora lilii]|uniref:Unnamed protein product n=1 Tax=Phytophthora lilii TaxID=2077276 RepID=A0A9W6WSH5_9STRA|nr:unnamed protein product [Phytophthora lilii]